MELRVHLKVCEGCGCLWYRAQSEIRVYCSSCHDRFKEFPAPQSRRRRGRPKKLTLPTVFAVHASAHTELDIPDLDIPELDMPKLDFPLSNTRSFPEIPAARAGYMSSDTPLPGTAVIGGAQ